MQLRNVSRPETQHERFARTRARALQVPKKTSRVATDAGACGSITRSAAPLRDVQTAARVSPVWWVRRVREMRQRVVLSLKQQRKTHTPCHLSQAAPSATPAASGLLAVRKLGDQRSCSNEPIPPDARRSAGRLIQHHSGAWSSRRAGPQTQDTLPAGAVQRQLRAGAAVEARERPFSALLVAQRTAGPHRR